MTAIAQELGESEYTKAYRASQVLEHDGLIRADYDVGNGIHAFLTGQGAFAVEHSGHTGIIPQFCRHPQQFLTPVVDQRIQNINYGSVSGQHVNFGSRIGSQSFASSAPSLGVTEILDAILHQLTHDAAIAEE